MSSVMVKRACEVRCGATQLKRWNTQHDVQPNGDSIGIGHPLRLVVELCEQDKTNQPQHRLHRSPKFTPTIQRCPWRICIYLVWSCGVRLGMGNVTEPVLTFKFWGWWIFTSKLHSPTTISTNKTSTINSVVLNAQVRTSSENSPSHSTLPRLDSEKETQSGRPSFLKRGYRACYTFLGFRKSYNFPLCELDFSLFSHKCSLNYAEGLSLVGPTYVPSPINDEGQRCTWGVVLVSPAPIQWQVSLEFKI